ncbi:MAG: aminopeptidase P family protein [Salinivirgaceae bacterium]|nr:aminopeptidase P family protein [Salinivirgaceae bacterium]
MENEKLEILRKSMKQLGIAAYIVPSSDTHKSEYIPEYWKTRAWLTGFNGSAGTAVVTQNHAGLWTDSRYFILALQQLEKPFELHKLATRNPEYIEWLLEELSSGDVVGIDDQLFSVAEFEHLDASLQKRGIVVQTVGDLTAPIWKNRPPRLNGKAFIHPIEFAIIPRSVKIQQLRTYLSQQNYSHILLTSLDEIAWLLNLRGNDIAYNPLVTSFCLVNRERTQFFVEPGKISSEVLHDLEKDQIEWMPYDSVSNILSHLAEKDCLVVDKNSLNRRLFAQIPKACRIVFEPSVVQKFKAIKNEKQLSKYREAQLFDGVAMCRFLCWLQSEIKQRPISEVEAGEMATHFRGLQPNFMGISFEPISAYQKNAASPHYSPSKENPCYLKPDGVYLIDSGGQYLGGTTDITRTVALGPVTREQKIDFTLVLKGHIRLAMSKFPKGTKGINLDALSRLDLWQRGKDFGHGTGHGIGYFLNVHEGPHGFSQAAQNVALVPFEPGMFVTNEPGYYLEGSYGIRTENVMVCQPDPHSLQGDFLIFETVSYCPLDKDLMDISLLADVEIEWINTYHQKVFELVSPYMNPGELAWLKDSTSPIKKHH